MIANHLQNSAQMEWVQRQLRGQRPSYVVEAAEKLGMQLRRVDTRWNELRQLGFPVLMQWRDAEGNGTSAFHWVVAYGTKGDRLIVADPLNPAQTCELIPRRQIEAVWGRASLASRTGAEAGKVQLVLVLACGDEVPRIAGGSAAGLLHNSDSWLNYAHHHASGNRQSDGAEQCCHAGRDGDRPAECGVFEAFLGTLRLFIFTHTARRLDLSLSAQLFRHLMRLPLAYFESRRVGDTVARVQELENIRQFLTGPALTVVLDSFFAVVYLVIMFYYSANSYLGFAVGDSPVCHSDHSGHANLRNWLNETFNRSADSQSS
jgi:ATP-binding cassette subfamily B protein